MDQPKEFVVLGRENKICKFYLSIWTSTYILKNGMKILIKFNNRLYSRRFDESNFILLYSYVDDIIIITLNLNLISKFNSLLSLNFDIKDPGQEDVI